MEGKSSSKVGLRVIGAILILGGLISLTPWSPDLRESGIAPYVRSMWLMGIWYVSGWPAIAVGAVSGVASLFAGVQLIRLRRNGWIVALAVLGYDVLSLSLFVATGRIEAHFREFASTLTGTLGTLQTSLMLLEQQHKVDAAYRVVIFFGTFQAVLLGYVASEWRCFVGRKRWAQSRLLLWTRLATGALVIGGMGLWAFWGADYLFGQRVLAWARSAPDKITKEDYQRLSLKGQRQVGAALVRTLTRDRPSVLPDILNRVRRLDLSLLTAEEIPGVVDLGRTGSADVRAFCYRSLFPDIGTAEVVRCITDAANGQKNSAWRSAVTTLSSLAPSSPVPKLLLGLPDASPSATPSLISLIKDFQSPRVTEILIEWIDNDISPANRMFAIRTLGRTCGVNFFSDKERWREWWRENRTRFASATEAREGERRNE